MKVDRSPFTKPGCVSLVLGFIVALVLGVVGVSTGVAHASPPPPIPGCAGGYNAVFDNAHTSWAWYEVAGAGSDYYLADGSANINQFCAVAESGGWQELRDSSGDCLGVNGTTDIYTKPCAATRPFDLWSSGSSPISNLLITNDWTNSNVTCTGSDGLHPVISENSNGNNDAYTQMRCPDYTYAGYGTEQTWDWVLIS